MSPSFDTFFRAATGRPPFLWQVEAAQRLSVGAIPDAIDVPTGFGKTSLIHAWVWALSLPERKVPLRLCYVVDRRLVVDAAFEEGVALQQQLEDDPDDGALRAVGAGLLAASGGAGRCLEVVRMRGGVTWDAVWLDRPDQPALIVGTTDQFGSRLLFRGYGTSSRMAPVDAALVGLDSWLLLDEAHIAGPLLATARAVAQLQTAEDERRRPLRVTAMSATVAERSADAVVADFAAETDDAVAPATAAEARRRAHAEKRLGLVDLAYLATAPKGGWRARTRELGTALAGLAQQVDSSARLVAIVANTVAGARAAHAELVAAGAHAVLLTGRCREHERQRLLDTYYDAALRVGSARHFQGRLYLVATQTVEVGVNIDVDALVTECAPLPSLVQRLGRVNRIGVQPGQVSLVVHAGFAHDDDPVYGEATRTTWDWLNAQVGAIGFGHARELAELPAPSVLEVGPAALRTLVAGAPEGVTPDEPLTPTLLGAHLERWVDTSPRPFPDQDVAAFLHGVDHGLPDVAVAWRAAPPDDHDDPVGAWRRWLELASPTQSEFVEVPVWEVRALLGGGIAGPTTDLESARIPPTAVEVEPQADHLLGVVLQSDGAVAGLWGSADVRPGDRIVLPSSAGGHDRWGWTGRPGDVVSDVGDLGPRRGAGRLRLSWRVPSTWAPHLASELREAAVSALRDDADAAAVLEGWLALDLPEPLAGSYRSARQWAARASEVDDGEAGVVQVLVAPAAPDIRDVQVEDEGSSSQTSVVPVTLDAHSEAVARRAASFAHHLGLDPGCARAVELAAAWHDLGKAEPRFQLLLHDGDVLAAALSSQPLAKSGRDVRDPVARKARLVSRLPFGFRHEALSGLLVSEMLKDHDAAAGVDVELVHHLVVSHHGHARPLLPPLIDPGVTRVTAAGVQVDPPIAQVDWAHPARFERLCERYGWWGLAWLETLVRLADISCSREGR